MSGIQWISMETILSYIYQIENKSFGIRGEPTLEEWHFIYYGCYNTFDLYLNITEDWIYFQVPLLKPEKKIHPQCRGALFQYMLRLNGFIHYVKLSLSPDDQVLCTMEIPAESFNFQSFRNTVEGLTTYLDRYGPEISIVAQQKEFARFIETGEFKKPEGIIIGNNDAEENQRYPTDTSPNTIKITKKGD